MKNFIFILLAFFFSGISYSQNLVPINGGCPHYVYLDKDHDGFGVNPQICETLISNDLTYADVAGDCNDYDAAINPNTLWYVDADGDHYGSAIVSSTNPKTQCTQPAGYVRNSDDCNDNDPAINPLTTWYLDYDGDGFGSTTIVATQCLQPINGVLTLLDCNDNDSNTKGPLTWYVDLDGDGFGEDSNNTIISCTPPQNGVFVTNNLDSCPNLYGTINGCIIPNVTNSSNNSGSTSNTGFGDDQNFILKITPKIPVTDIQQLSDDKDVLMEITYYDGLGRPMQNIAHAQSGTGKDIITHMEYDDFGREVKNYLPYVKWYGTSIMQYVAVAQSETMSFYSSNDTSVTGNPRFEVTDVPYSEKQFEDSPLNRVLEQAASGYDWSLNNSTKHTNRLDYQTNSDKEVKRFRAATVWSIVGNLFDISLVDDGFYDPNQLFKTITKNENWTNGDGNNNTTEEFKDKEGRVVLKKTYNNNEPHDTYYVYDIYGNLTYVLPPKVDTSQTLTDSVLNELCYQYKYDYRNRLVEKKLPGKQWEFLVYDKLDRLVATGPANAPFIEDPHKGWLITKYDAFNRVVYTGWFSGLQATSESRIEFQTTVNAQTNFSESKIDNNTIDNVLAYYTNTVFPTTTFYLLTVNYYDNYLFPHAAPLPTSVLGQNTILTNCKALATGTWVRVLTNWGDFRGETTTTFYDSKARPIAIHKSNHLGGYTISQSLLNFSGQVLQTKTEHKKDDSHNAVTLNETFEFSDQGRLVNHFHQINSRPIELIAHNDYDELGHLISKRVGGQTSDGLQKVDYTYNIRGWLTGINDITDLNDTTTDLFAFKINYNAPETAQALYNGNIAETFWRSSSDNTMRKYAYSYDNLNRLSLAEYQKPQEAVVLTNSYNESLQYDKNGNIMSLQRNGGLDSQDLINQIDDLTYSYDGTTSNRLVGVSDSTNNPEGFNDYPSQTDYSYDANGNMTADKNKDIDLITYNHLNLPTSIIFGSVGRITYLYNATGQKVQKTVENSQAGDHTITDYMDGFQYKNDYLQFFPTAEGYVNCNVPKMIQITVDGVPVDEVIDEPDLQKPQPYNYVYNYTDHLGNIRLSYAQKPGTTDLSIIEENHYYPFGLKHTNYNSDKMMYVKELEQLKIKPVPPLFRTSYGYKYNGKEYQDELGLNMYDYGARLYDPAIGRWMNIDPLAEQNRRWSPYKYCNNNPIRFVDPDGMSENDDWIKNNSTGEYTWDNNVTSPANTPSGSTYVGKEDSSIVKDLFSTSSSSTSDWDVGLISTEDFDNPYSASGAGFNNMKADTTLSVNVSADVSTTYNSDGSIQGKDFKGVNINATVTGNVVAPYPGVDISLAGSTTLQGNAMKTPPSSPYGDIKPGGDVPTLTYSSYWNSSSIQNNHGKSFDLNFSFKGQYSNGGTPMSLPGAAGLSGLPNSTNLNTSIKFSNLPPPKLINPNKL